MAKDNENGWNQHKIDVLNRLDKIEERQEAQTRWLTKIHTLVQVGRASLWATVATVSVIVSAAISIAAIYFKK